MISLPKIENIASNVHPGVFVLLAMRQKTAFRRVGMGYVFSPDRLSDWREETIYLI
jgi:hypothetical protein